MPVQRSDRFRVIAALAISSMVASFAATTPVQMAAGSIGSSVWDTDPNTVGVSLQLRNVGAATAGNVRITSIAVRYSTLSSPASFPVTLGDIPGGEDRVIGFVAKVPAVNGTSYLATITGQYTYAGVAYGFQVNRPFTPTPNSSSGGPFTVVNGVSLIQHPGTAIYPPNPNSPPGGPNAETPMLIPPGPYRFIFSPTPTPTPAGPFGSAGSAQINVNTSQRSAGVPPDPNAAAGSGNVVLSTYNTGISYSTDGGLTFTDVNLFNPQPGNPARTSFFPQSDGGLCCDQVVVYLPQQNLFVWLLQYWPVLNAGGTAITTPNRLRIAWATPSAIASDFWNAWTYCDLTGDARAGVDDGLGTTSSEWLDYPDLAYSGSYLYVGVDHGYPTPGQVYTGKRIVARLSLADIANPASTVVHYNRTEYTNVSGLNKDHFVQNAPSRMVLGALKNSSTFTVFSWADSDGSPFSNDMSISSIAASGSNPDYTAPGPDGTDWYAVSFPGNVTGATFRPATGEFMFAFDGGRNSAGGRPYPYVRLESLQYSEFFGGLIRFYSSSAEYDIWNGSYAYAMGALGSTYYDVAMVAAVGGGTFGYPQFAVGFKDDYVLYSATNSNAAQTGRFGDYLPMRSVPASRGEWATEVYDVNQNVSGKTCAQAGCTASMRYVRFGRGFSD